MSVASQAALISSLAEGRPEAILGTPESEWVDFKSVSPNGPYNLRTYKGKFELAKDVAGFANASGGLIVFGFTAKKRPTEFYETAEKLKPFEKALVNSDSYKDIIAEYVRPLLKVGYHWFDHPNDEPGAAGSYFVIEVAPMPEPDRWALVTRTVNEDGEYVKGSWTIPIRHGDRTVYLPQDEVYRLVNDGMRARREPVAAAFASSVAAPVPPEERVQARVDLRTRLELEDTPVLFFQSTPDHPQGLVPRIYAAGGLRDVLGNQQTLRGPHGFNFASVSHRPDATQGGLLLANAPRWGLLIEPDGAVTAAAAATGEMLAWAMERYGTSAQDRRISVFVLTELTLEYFRLVDTHVLPLVEGTWTHRIVAADFARRPARLLAEGDDPPSPVNRGEAQPATDDDWNQNWKALRDPERDAYEALRRIYHLFGLDVTTNPFIDADRVNESLLLGPRA